MRGGARALRVTLALLLATGCATSSAPPPGTAPHAPAPRQWHSPLHTGHPLVGQLWDVREGRPVDEATLRQALAGARYVLLGERHDNPDHHLLQAELVRALADSGRRPALALEMLDVAQQPAVDASRARSPGDVDALALAVDWAGSGWPDWSLYRPVFAAALEAGLPLVAANLPRQQVRALVKQGPSALEAPLRERLGLDAPLPEDVERALREEMRQAHCGHLPESLLGPMALAQRARDAHLADRMLAADSGQGAVLIAGAGHVRTDRGVPAHLARRAPGQRVLSVGLMEVDPEARHPGEYAASLGAGALPFDYVWFTPATRREDPCASLRGSH